MKHFVLFLCLISSFPFYINAQTSIYTTKACTTSVSLNDIKVEIRNYKNIKKFADFYCRGKIVIFKNTQPVDSVQFDKINQTGNYGLFLHHDIIPDHVLISKFGNEENKTIIVNNSGTFFILNGNNIYIDTLKKVLIVLNTNYPEQVTLFDYIKDTVIQQYDNLEFEPCQVVGDAKGHYFIRGCSKNQTNTYYLIQTENQKLKKVRMKRTPKGSTIQIVSAPKRNEIKCQCDCEYIQP